MFSLGPHVNLDPQKPRKISLLWRSHDGTIKVGRVLSVILLALAEASRGPHHQWNQIKLSGDLPGRRKMHGVAAAGQRLFIYGGYRSGGNYLDDLYEIEPSSGVSTQLVSPPHVTPLGRRLMVRWYWHECLSVHRI